MVYFESEPPDYAGEDMRWSDNLHRNPQERWKFIHDHILLKCGGIKEIKGAVDKIYETSNYQDLVNHAFSKGKKPPVKMTEAEMNQILKMIRIADNRSKKGINNGKLSFRVTSS